MKGWTCAIHGGDYPRRGRCPACASKLDGTIRWALRHEAERQTFAAWECLHRVLYFVTLGPGSQGAARDFELAARDQASLAACVSGGLEALDALGYVSGGRRVPLSAVPS